jgi:uncharacterized membrane protein
MAPPTRGVFRGSTARRAVTRDTLTLLSGALLAILVARVLVPPAPAGSTGSPDPNETGGIVAVDSNGPGPTLPPLDTLGPIVNPSTGLSATPTPIPVITLGPPTPMPSGSVGPSGSLKPTPKPTVGPPPTPTAPPLVLAAFSCVAGALPNEMDFTDHSIGQPTSWSWAFGDLLNGSSNAQNPTYVYGGSGDYVVYLTATGPGGTNTAHATCTVP